MPRLNLRNCVEVLTDQQEVDFLTYWANAYTSNLTFYRNQTTYISQQLKFTNLQVGLQGYASGVVLIGRRHVHWDTLSLANMFALFAKSGMHTSSHARVHLLCAQRRLFGV